MKKTLNSFTTKTTLTVDGKNYAYHSLKKLESDKIGHIATLPYSIRVLLENLLRYEDGLATNRESILAVASWDANATPDKEIFFMPSRVLLQDFTGVPAVADLAAMRNALQRLGGNPEQINPYPPADLVIDHSVQVDHYGSSSALAYNGVREFERNMER
ncbi:MAG: aconitate hydratase 1, partial [Halothiobacillaceae bacterium]